MHEEILSSSQKALLPLVAKFSSDFGLVGGTAIALQVGHRRSIDFEGIVKMPDLLTLAAMKAFSLGGRAKWKDYVDLYFLFKTLTLSEVVKKAEELFAGEFNSKLFREQLAYFKDINYAKEIEFLKGFEASEEEIKEFLEEISLQKD